MKTEKRHCYPCQEEKEFQILEGTENAVLRGSSHAVLWGNSHAELSGNSHAVLRGSSHAVLWGSSHAVLRESSHAELWESSHAVLWESSHAVLRESSHAEGSKYSSITLHGQEVHATGGIQIKIPEIFTAKEWCDYYGVEVKKGIATLFKAVDDDYSTSNARPKNIFYTPGSKPSAPDWDGGKAECGGGIHASCHPTAALYFNPQ